MNSTSDHSPAGDAGDGAAASGASGQVDAELFLALSDRLKEAFAKLTRADLPPRQRGRWQNRLLAITNAAKHDLAGAAQRLDRYEHDFHREIGT